MPQLRRRIKDWWSSAVLVGIPICLFTAIAPSLVNHYRLPFRAAASIYCSFLLLLILTLAPGVSAIREWITKQMPRRGKSVVLIVLWCLPYLVYSFGTNDLRWTAVARVVVVAAPLLVVYRLFPVRDLNSFTWQDLAVAAWLISVLLLNQLRGIWAIPANLDFMARLFLVSLAAWCWVFVRRVPQLGYSFSFSAKIVRTAALNFGLFAAIAIPSSLALHFTAWNPRWRGFAAFCVDYLEIFLFIALLEELFFRGFLQNLLSNNLKSTRKGQAIISCLFGLFHVLHAPFPNWRYVALATLAGWFYGSAFVESGNLMAPALTHAMVDTVWRTFFSKT